MELNDQLRRALNEAGLTRRASGQPPALALRPQPGDLPPARVNRADPAVPDELGIEGFLPGFWQDTPAGRVFVVERRYELDYRHGGYTLGSLLDVPPPILAQIGRHDGLSGIDHRQIVYLDTETTGLAGGTGTLAFLVGIGHFLDGHFRLRQYFLDSLEGEEALLRALSDYLERFSAVASFNGKVFDVPLLETRFILSRLRKDVRALPHLDLLFAARRMYRDRFESCRLGEIERRVLGLTRPDDVPSFEVPSLYFRYVRYRRFRALLPVFHHNALDILSLVTLAAHLGGLYGGTIALDNEDELALARVCEQEGRITDAIAHYRAILRQEPPPLRRDDAERRLSLIYKRSGRWQEATQIWERSAGRPENCSIFPHVELAMFCEQQQRSFDAALGHAEHALALLRRHHLRLGANGARQQELLLERRLTRLQKRIERPKRAQTRAILAPTPQG
ncbi:MAG TPA: ribonuclease H-like domain-containing protein [Dehalococcoidia bacterium]|nr:ribonuclease H-like domain-containing protein [Dehalococcoidia bacterium]